LLSAKNWIPHWDQHAKAPGVLRGKVGTMSDLNRKPTIKLPELRKQYDCGPGKFSGHEDALYKRHLTFDPVITTNEASARNK
jgi:hypothetical protein